MKKKSNQGHGKDAMKFAMPQIESNPVMQCFRQSQLDSKAIPRSDILSANSEAPSKGKKRVTDAVPNELAIDVKDSLSHLESAGKAAAALCTMNAHTIRDAVHDHLNGMGKIGSGTFAEGVVELADALESAFARSLAAWHEDQQGMIKGREHTHKAWINMSNAVGALKHTLDMQSALLLNHTSGDEKSCGQDSSISSDAFPGAMDCGFVITDSLMSAWEEAESLFRKMRLFFLGDPKWNAA